MLKMSLYAVPPLISALFFLALGLFVLKSNRKSGTNIVFAFMCFSTVGWQLTWTFLFSTSDPTLGNLLIRIGYSSIIFIPIFHFHFFASFVERVYEERFLLYGSYIFGVIFLTLLWTSPFLVNGYYTYFWGFYPKAGIAHPLWVLLLSILALRLVYLLILEARKPNLQQKRLLQIKYALVGFLFYFLVVSDIAVNYGIEFYPLGFIPGTISFGIFAYAIVKHQLLDIEVVIKRTLVFAGLAGSVVAVVSLMTFVTQDILVRYVAIPRVWSNILAAAIIAAVYGPLRNWLVNVTDRYLFQKRYDYKVLLKQFADEVVTIIDFKQLLPKTVNALTETVKLESCSLLLLNKDTRTYELAASKGSNGQALSIPEDEPVITFLRETHEPIQAGGSVKFPEAVTNRVKQLSARLCLPLAIHEDLIGVLCLGKKKSDEEFTKDDLDILLPLARTVAIAIANAQLFDELAKTQAEAAQKEKLAVIGTLSAGINHEICNPLGIVKTQCEAFLLDLEDGLLKDKPPQDVLERISTIMHGTLKQIDRATAITQKLSSFAKPIKQPTTEPVSVEHEVNEVIALVGHDLKLEKIEVKKEIPPELPSIVVDRRQLQEVLFNLIRNAGQAIKPPGSITVRARVMDGSQVRIEIEDTGSGISPAQLGKIYDPFFTTKEPGKGTGLGLFIVRQIVERNKGKITVESTVGKGTTFFLDFPAAKAAAAVVA